MASGLSPALSEHLAAVIPSLAADICRGCRLVPKADIEQGMWQAALERSEQLAELLAEGKAWAIRRKLQQAATRQIREEERYLRAKRALRLGYSPDDEAFYSLGLLSQLIPLYLDGGVAAEPPRGRELTREVSSSSESGNYLALMLDVDHAMGVISAHHRRILERYYSYPQGSGGWTHNEIASALGITPEACRKRVSRAKRAMQRELGGESPWKRQDRSQDREEAVPLERRQDDGGSGRA